MRLTFAYHKGNVKNLATGCQIWLIEILFALKNGNHLGFPRWSHKHTRLISKLTRTGNLSISCLMASFFGVNRFTKLTISTISFDIVLHFYSIRVYQVVVGLSFLGFRVSPEYDKIIFSYAIIQSKHYSS